MKALLLLLWLLPLWSWAKPEMIRPKVKTSTAFAIVVDRQSYDKVRTAVEAYRDAIEKDGHVYNSAAREAWSGEQLALREQLPDLFRPGSYVRFYDYGMQYPAKFPYLSATQRETADVILFHHHGADDTQYLNGYPEGSGVNLSIDNVKR